MKWIFIIGALAAIGYFAYTTVETDDIQSRIEALLETPTPTIIFVTATPAGAEPASKPGNEPVSEPAAEPVSEPAAQTSPHLRHIEEKRYMLELINANREAVGAPPVILGDNIAAQLHAESALANCFSAHWGIDGLKPYMRYTLAGGAQVNGENAHGLDYCIREGDGFYPNKDIRGEILDAVNGWLDSPGHRSTLLDKHYRKVNIGLAWNTYNIAAYQHFEGDYVEYTQPPTIENGILRLAGTAKNGVYFNDVSDLSAQIYYDPPPHQLTRGQISRTYCYGYGLQIASLREPLQDSWTYDSDTVSKLHEPCPDPYDVSPSAPAARSHDEANELWQEAYNASQNTPMRGIEFPWITAETWNANGASFSIKADISEVLAKHGAGVYTVVVWGTVGGEDTPISDYSIFHNTTPPDTYTPR